jgi:hypothetical protein
MPQKTAIENNRVGQNRLGITQMMAGNRLDRFMARNKIGQADEIHDRNVVGPMNRRETIAKLTFEDGSDGAATILEDVVVND